MQWTIANTAPKCTFSFFLLRFSFVKRSEAKSRLLLFYCLFSELDIYRMYRVHGRYYAVCGATNTFHFHFNSLLQCTLYANVFFFIRSSFGSISCYTSHAFVPFTFKQISTRIIHFSKCSVRNAQTPVIWMDLTAYIIVFFTWSVVGPIAFVCCMNSGCNVNIYRNINVHSQLFVCFLHSVARHKRMHFIN